MPDQSTAFFLFAHPDDEFGVFQCLLDELDAGHRVCCAYLTNGAFGKVQPEQRNRESIAVLTHLGVPVENIDFAGHLLAIPDGGLPDHLGIAKQWIRQRLAQEQSIERLYIPAWEGGHHDHDGLHAITVGLAQETNILQRMRQFSLYHSHLCPAPWFKVLAPLPQNGEVESVRIPWGRRWRFLRYCLSYPSQAKSWMGLFPFVAYRYFRYGTQDLQAVSADRLSQRPHPGALFYEQRNFYTWDKLRLRLEEAL